MSTQPALQNVLAPAPIRTPFLNKDGTISTPWVMWFNKLVQRVGGTFSEPINQTSSDATLANLSTDSTQSTYSDEIASILGQVFTADIAQLSDPDNVVSEVNTAIDYETGIWTPTFFGPTSAGSPVYTGYWTRIGNQLFWEIMINATGAGVSFTSNSGQITNLPLAAWNWNTLEVVNTMGANLGIGAVSGTTGLLPAFTVSNAIGIITGRSTLWL